MIQKWIFLDSKWKGQLKNVQYGISRPLGSREIQKVKVFFVHLYKIIGIIIKLIILLTVHCTNKKIKQRECHPYANEKFHLGGQSPENGTVRQCVTSKYVIQICSKFIKIDFTTIKGLGIPFKKTYRATSQTSLLCLVSIQNFFQCHTLTFFKLFVFDKYM